MFPNLRAEIARKGLTISELGQQIGMARTTIYDKYKGRTAFTLDEAIAIQTALGVDMSLDELFEKEMVLK